MKTENYEIINHGYDHSQYFPGCGTAFTKYDFCVTGAGDNAAEAYQDALDQVESIRMVEPTLTYSLPKRPAGIRKRDKVPYEFSKHEENEVYWYVSIRLKV